METASRTVPGAESATAATFRRSFGAVFVVLALLVWLFPFSLGRSMPVGGDVTQFFLGLTTFLSEALAARRLPVWNDLWGYGFPGIGESQMGVFYPPHVLLYGLLSVERAYVASMVLHTLWAGLGGRWGARRFGVEGLGAGVSGLAFAASGFFVIHTPHPWGYTTGSWTPWAWGLAWTILQNPRRGTPRRLLLLSAVLAMQVLPGHFQIAFMTLTTVAFMAFWTLLAGRSRGAWIRVGLISTGLAVVLPLAAAQVWPTARLAGMASDRRDYEYLSGFAATPFHLVSLAAPRLFHGSPLWRPLVWDPFHTSPEEYLAYVGAAPLILALATIRRERRDPAVRCLAALAVFSLILSLGPYVPGFGWLIRVPGFSFFRAPARWTLPMSLALAILAGKGLDRWRTWERPRRGLLAVTAGAVVWIVGVVGMIELALWSTSAPGGGVVASLFEKGAALRPWEGDPDFRSVASLARRPAADSVVPSALERAGFRRPGEPRDVRSFEQRRWTIYREELAVTAVILAAVAVVVSAAPSHHVPILLAAITFFDLLAFGSHRYIDIGPLRPVVEQSPVLGRLAELPRGTRAVDPLRNLPMAAGLAPVQAYRTLDLPAIPALAMLARGPLDSGNRGSTLKAMRAVGASVRVLDPVEVAVMRLRGDGPGPDEESIHDPELARWMYGPDWKAGGSSWADEFWILKTAEAPRAWLTVGGVPEETNGDPRPLLATLDAARPMSTVAKSPTEWEIPLSGFGGARGRSVLLSVLYDPQWQGNVVAANGGNSRVNIRPAWRVGTGGGAWMQIDVPGPVAEGSVLQLGYKADDVRFGLFASAACWTTWLAAILYATVRERRMLE